jgi:AAA-like domain
MGRSLQLRSSCKDKAKAALNLRPANRSQIEVLAGDLMMAEGTVRKFFKCEPVDRAYFIKLCESLNLDVEEVGEDPSELQPLDPTEQTWCQKMLEPSALIKIQAPSQFGKTTLMCRLLGRAEAAGHLIISINLTAIDESKLSDPQLFLRQFLKQIESKIDITYPDLRLSDLKYDENVRDFSPVTACIKYLEYLQKNISKPLTIGINKFDLLLPYGETAKSFCILLRLMYENSILGGTWANFRSILAYATPSIDLFIPIPVEQSPLGNVGYLIKLQELTQAQIEKLAVQRGLQGVDKPKVTKLMESVSGVPVLVKLTLDRIELDGWQILDLDPATLPNNHYYGHLKTLTQRLRNWDLLAQMQKVANNPQTTIDLPFEQQCRLHRLGLVIFMNNGVEPRCQLYRRYFSTLSHN